MAIEVARLYAVLGADTSPAERALRGFTGFVRNTFSTALGFALGQLFVGGIQGMIAEATQAIASFERMQMSLEALVAKEIKASGAVDSMAEALARAGPRAEELYQWVQKLAIESPFGAEDVMAAMRTALTYGFTTKEAQKLTEVMLDFAAATGASGDVMNRVALALGQIRQRGRLAGDEIRQLTEAGIGVHEILAEMGYTLEDVSKGLVSADAFITAFVKTMEEDFGGASKRQAETFTGLLNSLDDLKKMGLRAFFGGLYEAMKPLISGMVAWLRGPGLERLESWGQTLGRFASLVVAFLRADIGRLSGLFQALGVPDWVGRGLVRLSALMEKGREAVGKFVARMRSLDLGRVLGSVSGMEAAGEFVQTLMRAWQKYGPGLIQTAQATIARMREALQVALQAVAERVGPWMEAIFGRLQAWFEEYGPVLAEAAQQVMAWLGTAFSWLAQQVGPLLDVVFPVLQGLLELILGLVAAVAQAITGDWRGAWETLKESVANALGFVGEALVAFGDWVVGWFGMTWGQFLEMWGANLAMAREILQVWKERVINKFAQMALGVLPVVVEMWLRIQERFQMAMASVRKKVAEWVSALQNKWESMKKSLVQALTSMVATVRDFAKRMFEAGVALIQGLWEGLKHKIGAVLGWLQEQMERIKGMMAAVWGWHSPARVTVQLGEDIMRGFRMGLERGARMVDVASFLGPRGMVLRPVAVASGPGQVVFHVYETQDAEETARAVVRMLRLNGWL